MSEYFYIDPWKVRFFPKDHSSMQSIRSMIAELPLDEKTKCLPWATLYPTWSIDLAAGDGLSFEEFEQEEISECQYYKKKQLECFTMPSVFEKHAVELRCPIANEFLERSQFELGQVLGFFDSESLEKRSINRKHFLKAKDWLLDIAEAGNASAQYLLAQSYRHDLFGRDMDKSAYWMAKSASQGLFGAIFELGNFIHHGLVKENQREKMLLCFNCLIKEGIDSVKNELETIELLDSWRPELDKLPRYKTDDELESDWKVSLTQSRPDTCFLWQLYYRHSKPWSKLANSQKAIRYIDMLIDHGHCFAKKEKAMLYYFGELVEQDFQKAVRLLKEGASLDFNSDEFDALALIYFEGVAVPKDLEESQRWFIKAIEKRSPTAEDCVRYLVKDGIFPKATLELIEKAKQVAYPPIDEYMWRR